MLTLYALECGHGDTLLLSMPGGKWALVDCKLPGKATRENFFRLANRLGILRLDYVVLTHPDFDHYAGMWAVLEHFSTEDRSLGFYCDSGHSPESVLKLLAAQNTPPDEVEEFVRLVKTRVALYQKGKLKRHLANDQVPYLREVGIGGVNRRVFGMFPIAPSWGLQGTATDTTLLEGKSDTQPNDLSVVLVVRWASGKGKVHRLLLPGDAEGVCLDFALQTWASHEHNVDKEQGFDLIKVPHHGSTNRHDVSLCRTIAAPGRSVAVISCGTHYGLPAREVLADYLRHGWRVFSMCVRHPPGPGGLGSPGIPRCALRDFHQRGRSSPSVPASRMDVVVRLGPRMKQPNVSPTSAGISTGDLPHYVGRR